MLGVKRWECLGRGVKVAELCPSLGDPLDYIQSVASSRPES